MKETFIIFSRSQDFSSAQTDRSPPKQVFLLQSRSSSTDDPENFRTKSDLLKTEPHVPPGKHKKCTSVSIPNRIFGDDPFAATVALVCSEVRTRRLENNSAAHYCNWSPLLSCADHPQCSTAESTHQESASKVRRVLGATRNKHNLSEYPVGCGKYHFLDPTFFVTCLQSVQGLFVVEELRANEHEEIARQRRSGS